MRPQTFEDLLVEGVIFLLILAVGIGLVVSPQFFFPDLLLGVPR